MIELTHHPSQIPKRSHSHLSLVPVSPSPMVRNTTKTERKRTESPWVSPQPSYITAAVDDKHPLADGAPPPPISCKTRRKSHLRKILASRAQVLRESLPLLGFSRVTSKQTDLGLVSSIREGSSVCPVDGLIRVVGSFWSHFKSGAGVWYTCTSPGFSVMRAVQR